MKTNYRIIFLKYYKYDILLISENLNKKEFILLNMLKIEILFAIFFEKQKEILR